MDLISEARLALKGRLLGFIIGAVVLGPTLCLLSPEEVFAQEKNQSQSALGVAPAIVELVLDPGVENEASVIVFNVTNFPLPIKASTQSFLNKEEISSEAAEIFDASSWITVDPADFILQPRERKEIKVLITPPSEAEPGGHYATVLFQPLVPVEVLSPQTAYLTARVGVLAFLVVKGEMVEQASLGKLQSASFQQFGPVEFKLPFKNEGNLHLMPLGEVKIVDFRDREVATIEIAPTTVLPKTTKRLSVVWDKKYLIGKFTAWAIVFYGSERKSLENEKIEFWVVPWIPLLLAVMLLTTGIILVIVLRGRLIIAVKVLVGSVQVQELPKRRARKRIRINHESLSND